MPSRDTELPEGTDHIINGAMETGAGTGASTGSAPAGGTTTGGTMTGSTTTGSTGGGASSGFIGGGTAGIDDTGGTASGGGDTTGSGGGTREKMKGQMREQIQSLKGQATDKAREYADQGKERATTALDNFSEVVQDAARSVDERLGSEYGQYAHRAADAVTQLAEGLRGKSVDDLLEDSRAFVRRNPLATVAGAALAGFVMTRVIRAGLDDEDSASVPVAINGSTTYEGANL